MLNFGPVYTFFKNEFLRNEHWDPLFFISIYNRHDELCMRKVLKKICPLEEFVTYLLNSPHWSRLIQIGQDWSILIQISPDGSKLGQIDPDWSKLVHLE